MGTRIRAVLSVGAIAVCVGLAASACSSGSTAGVESASSSASASPAFPVESLPPGVQKDSVQDLNSTKDMTGVVTTVPAGQSPYIDYLPDVCDFIPDSLLKRFGLSGKTKGFKGTRLVVQSCTMQGLDARGLASKSVTVSYYINNISEVLEPSKNQIIMPRVQLSDRVFASVKRMIPSGPEDEVTRETCGTAWGTFFGAIVVNFRQYDEGTNPVQCQMSLAAARLVAPSSPRSPSQMRPSS